MNLTDAEGKSAGGAAVSSADTRLTGRWLIIARTAWLVLVIPSLGLFIANLVAYDQQLQKACAGLQLCYLPGALTAKQLQALPTIGFSASGYAALLTIAIAIIVSICCAVGFLIFWRRSDDWLALLAAFFLVMFSITPAGDNPGFVLLFSHPALALPVSLVSFLGQASIYMFFLLFPNGRLVPRWTALILLLALINAFLNNFPSPQSPFEINWPAWLNLLDALVLDGAILGAQIYRYRRVSTPVQRQQTKWIVLGAAALVGIVIVSQIIASFVSPGANVNSLAGAISNIIFYLATLLIPLSIGFSILRYRLYDIDLLINRTLVYGMLTVILALIYFGSIVGLQALLRGIINANNSVAIVVSTLVIAAIFQPLRHRIQAIIDRRFYRRKYDATRTIAAFSATLRNEVELKQLSEHLVTVVEETMQPKYISLWLRPASREKTGPNQ